MSNAADAWESGIAALYFMGDTFDGIAENDTTSPLTAHQYSLHTSSPGDGGAQNSNEIGYTGYARKSVARSSSGYNRTGGVITFDAPLSFDQGSGGSGSASDFGIGVDSSGAGTLHLYGALTPAIATGDGVTPTIDVTVTID